MELLLELALTVSLSLIFTFLFIKLAAMDPIVADNGDFAAEAVKIDRFQWMPLQGDVIELEECKAEGKSSVKLHNYGVINGEKYRDVVVVEGEEEACFEVEDEFVFGENGGERKACEIEIESVEEEEEEGEGSSGGGEGESVMSDWEEIGRQDFEELLGKSPGLYVNAAYQNI